jgi:hypothetical protein
VLSIPTPTSATAAKASSFAAPGTTPATAKVAFVALPATTTATAETSFAATTSAPGSTSPIITGSCLGLGFIDGNSPALQFLAVQTINGCLPGFFGGHFHKAKSLGFATEFIHDYTD